MAETLRIDERLAIPLAEIELRASRSSGPGGQHANVTASRVEAVFDVEASRALDEARRIAASAGRGRWSPPSPRTRAARRATANWRCGAWRRRSPPAWRPRRGGARPGRPAPRASGASKRSAGRENASGRDGGRAATIEPLPAITRLRRSRRPARLSAMAKRKKKRPPRQKAPTVDYVDAEGNTLSLRESLSPGTIAKLDEGPATAATTAGGRLASPLRAALRAPRGELGDRRPAP